MHAALHHIARRGVEQYSTFKEEYQYEMPIWGILMLASTGILYLIAASAIEYTFGRLIPTLVIIESPQALLFEPLDSIDPDAPINKNPTEPELLLVKQKPITASFRTAVRHLQSKGGFWARFRGLSMFICYSFALSTFSNAISSLPLVPPGAGHILAAAALATWSMAWTHIVISDPSPKPWYRRLPERRLWKKIAGPTALVALAEELAIMLPIVLAYVYGFDSIPDPKSINNMTGAESTKAAFQGLSIFVLAIALGIFLVFPANVMLTRVQASLLPDSEETIVPFDRSFGGKVIPEIVGGTGAIGLLDAWKTFDWNARVRLIKTYVKVFAIQTAVTFLFVGVAIAQLFIIVGKSDLKKIIDEPSNDPELATLSVSYGG